MHSNWVTCHLKWSTDFTKWLIFLEKIQQVVICFYLKVQESWCSFTGMEFSARKSRKDHPSKMKAADESMRVTKKKVCVFEMVRQRLSLKSRKAAGRCLENWNDYQRNIRIRLSQAGKNKTAKILRILRIKEKYCSSWIEVYVHSCCGKWNEGNRGIVYAGKATRAKQSLKKTFSLKRQRSYVLYLSDLHHSF